MTFHIFQRLSLTMDRGFFLVVATLTVLAAVPTVRGTEHLTFDNSVEANVTREGCDMTALCLETPEDCDPQNNQSCLFSSLNASSSMAPFNLSVGLSGNFSKNSTGIAFGLTQNFTEENTQLFICGRNSTGGFLFATVTRYPNGSLESNERNTTQIRNQLNDNNTQCEFIIPNVNTSMMNEMLDGTTAVVVLGRVYFNMNNTAANFTLNQNFGRVNLTDVMGTVMEPLNITREGCGMDVQCLETPEDCNPVNNQTCLFSSLNASSSMAPFNLTVGLSGNFSANSTAIAFGLTQNFMQGNTQLYICGSNRTGGFFFETAMRFPNGSLQRNTRNTMLARSVLNENQSQCEFTIPNVNTSMRGETRDGTTAIVVLGTVTVNSTTDMSEGFMEQLISSRVNLTEANGTILPKDINSMTCGVDKLCIESPANCNPQASNCLFSSLNTNVMSGNLNVTVELDGDSSGSGYIALGLTRSDAQDMTNLYVCGRNGTNNEFVFQTLVLNNTNMMLSNIDEEIDNLCSFVNTTSIQCTFTIVNPGSNIVSTRQSSTRFNVSVGNGTIEGGVIGSFDPQFITGLIDITDASADADSELNITREGCNETNLCLSTPSNCDPLVDNMCQFMSSNTSTIVNDAFNMTVRLRGYSTGFFALALAPNASVGSSSVFVCGASANGNRFQTLSRNNTNGAFTMVNSPMTSNVITDFDGRSIQCQFDILNLGGVSTRQTDGSVADVTLANGTLNETTGLPIEFISLLNIRVNLTDVMGTVIEPLNITREGCGMDVQCLETPEDCNPVNNQTCLFSSLNASSSMAPFNLTVGLSGNFSAKSTAIAFGLTQNFMQGNTQLYICGSNSAGEFFFETAMRFPNGSLQNNTRSTIVARSVLNENQSQCEFTIPNVNTSVRGETRDGTTAIVVLGTVTVNNTNDEIEGFMEQLISSRVNLTEANGIILPKDINNMTCGIDKLCIESPANCNPQASNCLFSSLNTNVMSGNLNVTVELDGDSSGSGYIALGLTQSDAPDITNLFVCGRNGSNNEFVFRTLVLNNNNMMLSDSTEEIVDLCSFVNSSSIQCTFTIVNLGSNRLSTRQTSNSFSVSVGNGTIDGDDIGAFTAQLDSGTLDITNANADGSIIPELNITRDGCGMDVLCLETPEDCNPVNNQTCLFSSLDASSSMAPFNLTVGLSGNFSANSTAIAFGLTQNFNQGNTQLYICGSNSAGEFFFETAMRFPNGSLQNNTRSTIVARSVLNENQSQCEFTIPNVNTSMRGETRDGTTAIVVLGTVTVNNTNDEIEGFMEQLISSRVNLTEANGIILPKDINNMTCGIDKLCIESPANCNPQDPNCLFSSLNTSENGNLSVTVELDGDSSGSTYIALGLTQSDAPDITNVYVCGRNITNNELVFRTLVRNNTNMMLSESKEEIVDLCSFVNSSSIQCTFTIVNLGSNRLRTRQTSNTFNVSVGTGSIEGDDIGAFNVELDSGPLDITNPNADGSIVPELNLTRDGCGMDVLCLETPEDCNPVNNQTCLFSSLNASPSMAPFNLTVGLSGNFSANSTAIAFGLTQDFMQGNTQLYICGSNSTGGFFFETAMRFPNGSLQNNTRNTILARSVLNENQSQCEFTIPNVDTRMMNETMDGTTAVVVLGRVYFYMNDTAENFMLDKDFGRVNLTDVMGRIMMDPLNLTREGCGIYVQCLETPEDCNPVNNQTCLFSSLNASSSMAGFNLNVGLSGNFSESSTAIAFGLTQNFMEENTQLYICGRNSTGGFFFNTARRYPNGSLQINMRNTILARSALNENQSQCEFTIPNVDTRMRGETRDGTTAIVVLGTVTVNSTTDEIEGFMERLTSSRVNLTEANGTILPKDINNMACGRTKLCIESPANCNPQAPNCLFTSLETSAMNGNLNVTVELDGDSSGSGYIALGLTQSDAQNITNIYVCGRNGSNNEFVFRALVMNNTNNTSMDFYESNEEIVDVCSFVNGTSIQCTFTIVNLGSNTVSTRQSSNSFNVSVGNGTIDGDVIGRFDIQLDSGIIDITKPNDGTELNIIRAGCNETNLCLSEPKGCNPLEDNMCQFMSSNTSNPKNITFDMTVRLRGYSMGFFALALSSNASVGSSSVFLCGGTTNGRSFQTLSRDNTNANIGEAFNCLDRRTSDLETNFDGRSIQCQFNILNINGSSKWETNGSLADVILANGTLNESTGLPMEFNILLTARVNLTSPNGTICGAWTGKSSNAMMLLPSIILLLALLRG
ncbi:uncharacterized protein LOC130930468 isoform X1 [Corythoichthys intestinalis]|uniref:uncharacterized protein LOC130930468 isoform X1 n=1 Tax=Corythoichthys intestinalis TaxID=161448 RepID=UPI0025A5DFA4|nr:uncharacterized protein LOC130930468 isoform X1 [Corythoichthys intestinalis]